MNSILELFYLMVTNDPQYNIGTIRDEFLGEGIAESAIFIDTFLMSLLFCGLISGLFYLLGLFFPINKLVIWIVFLLGAAGACFAFSYNFIGNADGMFPPPDAIESIGWKYIITSTVLGGIYFSLFSLLFRAVSPISSFTKHTP